MVSIQSWADVSNKNPFEPLIVNQNISTASEFVSLVLTQQETFLNSLPEYSKKLKGIQSYRLSNEFRRAQFFYHNAVLEFLNKNIKQFISLNPTPEQVNAVLKRAVVDPPLGMIKERPLFFSKALNIQKKLLDYYIPKAGKLEAIERLLNYEPHHSELFYSRAHIVESHIEHLTKIGLIDNTELLKSYNKDKPFFFDTIRYLKYYFHYPYLSSEQKTKKLISILLNTYEDVQLDFIKYKKSLLDSGIKVSADFLYETGSLQYANAKMQANFLESQLLLVLKNYLESHFVTIKLNQYDAERLLKLSKEYGYTLEFHNNKLVGLLEKPGIFQTVKNLLAPKPKFSRPKMCFLIFK